VRQVHLTIGPDPYLHTQVTDTLTTCGWPFHHTDTDHGTRYTITTHHPPGPDIDVVLLTHRHLLAAALHAHLALTRTAIDHLPAALDYAATGHLGFPHLHTLTTAGLLTPDETNLWRLIAHGTPNHRIAATLGHSPRTLSRRLPAFYQPIGATTKPHATRLCSRALHPHPHPAPRGHNTNEKYRYA